MRYVVFILVLSFSSTLALAAPNTPSLKQTDVSKVQKLELILHAKPDAKSKIVAKLPQGSIIIPIFKKGKWVKVGSPLKGDVGWISQENIKQGTYTKIYVKSIMRKSTSVNKADPFKQITKEEAAANEALRQFTKHGIQSVEDFNKQIANILKHMDVSHQLVIPIIQPVIYVPQNGKQTANAGSKPAIEGFWQNLLQQIKAGIARFKARQETE